MPIEKDLSCSIVDTRRLCQRTADHITALCAGSNKILTGPATQLSDEDLRNGYILTLLALEETGKLFRMWQTAANAEMQNSDSVIVRDLFRNHQAKGGLAGDLCCQMLDYVVSIMQSDRESMTSNSVPMRLLADASDHLKETYQDFKTAREAVMYTAHDEGRTWGDMSGKVRLNVGTENLLLMTVSAGARSYLESGGSFNLAIRGLLDIQRGVQSDQAFALAGRMAFGFMTLIGTKD